MIKKYSAAFAVVIGLAGCDSGKETQSTSQVEPSSIEQAEKAISKAVDETKENAELINENIQSNEYANPASEKMAEAGKSITDSSSDAAEIVDENLDSIKENIESNPPFPPSEQQ